MTQAQTDSVTIEQVRNEFEALLEKAPQKSADAIRAAAEVEAAAAVKVTEGRGLTATNGASLWWIAKRYVESGDVPEALVGDTLVATISKVWRVMSAGSRFGLDPSASLGVITLISGRECIYGAGVMGIVRKSGKLGKYEEEEIGKPGDKGYGWRITLTRKDDGTVITREFTKDDAATAGIGGKAMHKKYPRRMYMHRAVGLAARDAFPEVMGGFLTYEELVEADPVDTFDPERMKVRADAAPEGLADEVNAKMAAAGVEVEEKPQEPEQTEEEAWEAEERRQAEIALGGKEEDEEALFEDDEGE